MKKVATVPRRTGQLMEGQCPGRLKVSSKIEECIIAQARTKVQTKVLEGTIQEGKRRRIDTGNCGMGGSSSILVSAHWQRQASSQSPLSRCGCVHNGGFYTPLASSAQSRVL
jgi:hypothetical protein